MTRDLLVRLVRVVVCRTDKQAELFRYLLDVRRPHTVTEIADWLGRGDREIRRDLVRLEADGLAARIGRAWVAL